MKSPKSLNTDHPSSRPPAPVSARLKRVIDPEQWKKWIERKKEREYPEETENLSIAEIRTIIQQKIVWGLYAPCGDLLNIEEFRSVEEITPDDWELFQELYLKGLQSLPWAFGEKYKDQKEKTKEDIKEFLRKSTVLGIKHTGHNDDGREEKLIGIMEYRRGEGVQKHTASPGKLYVHPKHRNRNMARNLSSAVLDKAVQEGVEQVNIIVTSNNSISGFYKELGFRKTHTKANAAKIDNEYYDWDYMTLDIYTYLKKKEQ